MIVRSRYPTAAPAIARPAAAPAAQPAPRPVVIVRSAPRATHAVSGLAPAPPLVRVVTLPPRPTPPPAAAAPPAAPASPGPAAPRVVPLLGSVE